MPRRNRLEVTPPPARAHGGTTKTQIPARGVDQREHGYVMYVAHHHTGTRLHMPLRYPARACPPKHWLTSLSPGKVCVISCQGEEPQRDAREEEESFQTAVRVIQVPIYSNALSEPAGLERGSDMAAVSLEPN